MHQARDIHEYRWWLVEIKGARINQVKVAGLGALDHASIE